MMSVLFLLILLPVPGQTGEHEVPLAENQCLMQRVAIMNGHDPGRHEDASYGSALVATEKPHIPGRDRLIDRIPGQNAEPLAKRRARAIHVLEKWVMRLRDFMLSIAWTTILVGLLLNLVQQQSSWCLPRLQALEIHVLLSLVMLAASISLASESHGTRQCVLQLAMRYFAEGYMVVVALLLVPLRLDMYMQNALLEETKLKKSLKAKKAASLSQVAAVPFARQRTTLTPPMTRHRTTLHGPHTAPPILTPREETPECQDAPAPRDQVTSLRPTANFTAEVSDLSGKIHWLLLLLCAARPGCCILFAIALSFWSEPSIVILVVFSIVNLCIFLAGLSLTHKLTGEAFTRISEYLVVHQSVSIIVAFLPVLGAIQDIFVIVLFGTENLGVAFANQLYLHQVVGVFIFIAYKFSPKYHPLIRLRDVDPIQVQSKFQAWLVLVAYALNPRNFLKFSSEEMWDRGDDAAVRTFQVLVRWVRADQQVQLTSDSQVCEPVQLTKQEEQWKQEGRLETKTTWLHVLFDVSTSRVRSPFTSAAALTIVVDLSLALVGPINSWIYTLNVGVWGGLLILAVQLCWAISIWMVCGLLLIGNNVFVRPPWLSIAIVFFLGVASRSFFVFFLPPQWLAEDFTLLWRNFFRGCVAVAGFLAVLRSYVAPVASNYFFQVEITAMRYTRSLFSGLLHGASSKRIQAVRSVNSMARWYPPVLIAAIMASVPLVLATSYFIVLSTMDILHRAEELQLSMEVINSERTAVPTEKLGQNFIRVFDRNNDERLERDELGGLFLGLESLGLREAGEQTFAEVTTEGVQGDEEKVIGGQLDRVKVQAFIKHLRLVATAAQLFAGEIDPHILAGKLLHAASNPCLEGHDVEHVMRTAMLAMSPGTGELIQRKVLRSALTAAGVVDPKSCLTIEQASTSFSFLRDEFRRSRQQVQHLVRLILGYDPEHSLLEELEDLDVDDNGLSISEAQPLVRALSLLSQDLKSSLRDGFRHADFDADGHLSATELTSKHEDTGPGDNGSKQSVGTKLLEQVDVGLIELLDRSEVQKNLRDAIDTLQAISTGRAIRPQKVAAAALRRIVKHVGGSLHERVNGTSRVTLQKKSSSMLHKKNHDQNAYVPVSSTGEVPSYTGAHNLEDASPDELMSASKFPNPRATLLDESKHSNLDDDVSDANNDPIQDSRKRISELKSFVQYLQPLVQKAIDKTNKLVELIALEEYDSVAKFMLKNYDSDDSKSLSKSELSDAFAPIIATLYPILSSNELTTSAMLPRVADADSDGVLDESELPYTAQLLRERLLAVFGDVNRDGARDSKDLLVIARSGDVERRDGSSNGDVDADINHFSSTFAVAMMQVNHASGLAPRSMRASFVASVVHQSFGPVAAPGRDFFPSWQQGMVKNADEFLRSVPVHQVRICAILSGVVAVAFSLYILSTAFRGYAQLFEKMQTGKREYKGQSYDLRSQYGVSTLFLGMVMSMMVCGWILCYVAVLAVSSVSTLMLQNVWNVLSLMILFLAASGILFVFRTVLSRKLQSTGGEITFPGAFACMYVVLIVMSFVFGVLASVVRFFTLLPIMTYRFFSLDQTMAPERFAFVDPGYFSLLTLTYTSYQNLNPLRHSFISFINKTAHRLYGPSYKTSAEICNWDPGPESASSLQREATEQEIQRARRRKVIRNRLWLAYTLHHNPGLSEERGANLQNRNSPGRSPLRSPGLVAMATDSFGH